jgi:hypothetical protein
MDASSAAIYDEPMLYFGTQRRERSRPPSLFSRREMLTGTVATISLIPSTTSCAASPQAVAYVTDYRRPSDPDDTLALARALQTGAGAHFPAGRGSASDGAYLIDGATLPAGAKLSGDGEASILRAAPGAKNVLVAMSAAPARTLDGIALTDLRIEGPVAQVGFHEHWHLVALSGVRGVRIERVQFVGFAGDGLYLGAEREGPTREPRVVSDVVVRNCLFDGVNNDNRNGISVTGGSNITITQCRFRRCTRSNMPGPIDFEPDAFPFYRLAQIIVSDCDFEECGGNVGQVAFAIPAIVPPPRGIKIMGNRFRAYRGTGGDIVITINRQPDAAMPTMDLLIADNIGFNGDGGVQIFSAKGLNIRNNRWISYSSRSFLGFAAAEAGVTDASISDQYEGCGWRDGVALAIYKGDNIRVEGARFIATGNGGPGSAPLYIGPGRVRRLAIIANDWRDNPAARGLIIVERGADYLRGTARIEANLLPEGKLLPAL